MNITDAANICRPLDETTFRQRGPQDETLDLADKLIGAERERIDKQERQSNVPWEYRMAARELEAISCNLVAYARGMIHRDAVPGYIVKARVALALLETALRKQEAKTNG